MLSFNRPCVGRSSLVFCAVDALVAVYTGARAPVKRSDGHDYFLWRYVPHREMLEEPPFFFKEVRLTLLAMSLLFGVARLIYEAVFCDVSVVLVAVRLCGTAYQFADQWWLCTNWKPFFVEHKLRAFLWLRFYVVLTLNFWVNLLAVMNDANWVYFAFRLVMGFVVVTGYLWGKRWAWRAVGLVDERRVLVGAYTAMAVSGLFFARSIYDIIVHNRNLSTDLAAFAVYLIIGVIVYVMERRQRQSMETIQKRKTSVDLLTRSLVETLRGSSKSNLVACGADDDDHGSRRQDEVEDEGKSDHSNDDDDDDDDHPTTPAAEPSPAPAPTSRAASVVDIENVLHVRRASLQRGTKEHEVDTILVDRIIAVVYQVLVYYTLLFLTEPILERAYYSPATGSSMVVWCPSFVFTDPMSWVQLLSDCTS